VTYREMEDKLLTVLRHVSCMNLEIVIRDCTWVMLFVRSSSGQLSSILMVKNEWQWNSLGKWAWTGELENLSCLIEHRAKDFRHGTFTKAVNMARDGLNRNGLSLKDYPCNLLYRLADWQRTECSQYGVACNRALLTCQSCRRRFSCSIKTRQYQQDHQLGPSSDWFLLQPEPLGDSE